MSNFCTPSPFFLSVRMGPNWARRRNLGPGRWNLGYHPPSLHPHPLWYCCSISIILSRHFHHIPGQYNSQPFTTKNQFKLNSIFCSKTQASHLEYAKNKTKMLRQNQAPIRNTYSRTRHQSGTLIAEPDPCLEHSLDSNNTYTNYRSGHPISADPSPCNHS